MPLRYRVGQGRGCRKDNPLFAGSSLSTYSDLLTAQLEAKLSVSSRAARSSHERRAATAKGPTHTGLGDRSGVRSQLAVHASHISIETATRPSTTTRDQPTGSDPLDWQRQKDGRRTVSGRRSPRQAVETSEIRGFVLDGSGRKVLCPCCEGKGFIKFTEDVETCPVCQQWPEKKPLRVIEDIFTSDNDSEEEASTSGRTEEGSEQPFAESNAEIRAWQERNRKRSGRTVKITHNNGAKISAAKKGRPGVPHTDSSKRRIAAGMRNLQRSTSHRRRISEKTRGKAKVCSLCGEEGHNKRGCPLAKAEKGEPQERLSHAEIVELRAKRREERKLRPKSRFKGLSWDSRCSRWAVRVWDGRTVRHVGMYEDEEEAAKEYDKAVLATGREDAVLNFQTRKTEDKPAANPDKPSTTEAVPLPTSSKEVVSRAVESITAAWKTGTRRQRLEFLLPLNSEGEAGGVKQEFAAARDMVEATLLQLKQRSEFAGRISVEWLDTTDCVASWQNEKLAAVVFCTADCLQQLKNIDGGEAGNRLTLVINPQWQIDGQIVSDFGFGQSRRNAEEFVRSFQDVFVVQRRRIMGDKVYLLKCFDSKWQVHYVWPNGRGQSLISEEAESPTYERLLALMRAVPGSKSSRSWVERVLNTDWSPTASDDDSTDTEVSLPEVQQQISQISDSQRPDADRSQASRVLRQPDDRFTEGRPLLDPVMTLPGWQRQVLGNAFGRDRGDQTVKPLQGLEARKAALRWEKEMEKAEADEQERRAKD